MKNDQIKLSITNSKGSLTANTGIKLTDTLTVTFSCPIEFIDCHFKDEVIQFSRIDNIRELGMVLYEALLNGVRTYDSKNPDFQRLKKELSF